MCRRVDYELIPKLPVLKSTLSWAQYLAALNVTLPATVILMGEMPREVRDLLHAIHKLLASLLAVMPEAENSQSYSRQFNA